MSLWKIEDDELWITPHEGQARAWRSDKRFVFIISGTQGGKTEFGPVWLYREIQKCGAGDYLAVTASFDLFKLKLLPTLRSYFEGTLKIGKWWAGDKVMELCDPETGEFGAKRADDADRMWGRIILRSSQSDGGLEAATAQAAWLDECGQDGFTLEDWEAVNRRLSINQGRVLGTTTPYSLNWLKTEVYDRWRAGDPDIDVITFPSYTNPAFPKEEYDRMEGKMQPWKFRMFYGGQFTRPAGMIYSCWDDEWLVDDFEIPYHWDKAIGIDFGGANNAVLCAARKPDTGVWYIFNEWHGGGMTSKQYANKGWSMLPERPEDYDDEEPLIDAWGGAGSEEQQRRDWDDGGFPISRPPISDVESGIDRGIELMQDVGLRVFRSCKGFRDEIGSYKRELDNQGNPTDKIENKRKFHRMDAYRYLASGIIESSGPIGFVA